MNLAHASDPMGRWGGGAGGDKMSKNPREITIKILVDVHRALPPSDVEEMDDYYLKIRLQAKAAELATFFTELIQP